MEKWRVLLLVEYLAQGGCERDAAKIAVGLDRSCFEPHVAVFHAGGYRTPEVEAAGVPILALPVRSFLNSTVWQGARQLSAYIRQHRIQLVHAFDVPVDIFAAPVARFCRVPVVITAQLSYRNMYARSRQVALRMTDWLADRVVVNSRAVGESLTRESGLDADKIYLCYNGVNPEEFYPGPGTRPPGFENTLVIGSVCVMRKEKRIDWVLRAFKEVFKLRQDLRLVLVGSGPEVANLMALRDELGLHEVCFFEPGRPDIAGWMRGIDIYINSSASESFPNALLEAMACGCCVIGSKVGGIPELVTHREDGLVFDSENASHLVELLQLAVTDAGLREKMRRQAVQTAHQRFSMRINLDRTEALYKTLLEQKGVQRLETHAETRSL
jgi:glycosyltransferase involved in cell wall biosynthesis